MFCRHMGVQYASPGKWPSPKHPGNAKRVKDDSSAVYRVVIVKPCNMWDRPDTRLKQEEDKDDAVLITPSSSAAEEDSKSTTEVVNFRTDAMCAVTDLCSEGGDIHKQNDCETHDTEGGTKEECRRSCSATRKLPKSIISALDRQHRLSVGSGPSGDRAISGEVEVSRKTEESGGRRALLDIDAVDSLLMCAVNEENKSSGGCTVMDSDTSEMVLFGDHAVESQQYQTQEDEFVMEHAPSNKQDCFTSSSPSMGASGTLPTDNYSALASAYLPPAGEESLSTPIVQSPNAPSQIDQPLTDDGVGPQNQTPASCQPPPQPDVPCWLTPLLTAPSPPSRLLVFSDNCKQHRLVKGMMAEVRVCVYINCRCRADACHVMSCMVYACDGAMCGNECCSTVSHYLCNICICHLPPSPCVNYNYLKMGLLVFLFLLVACR